MTQEEKDRLLMEMAGEEDSTIKDYLEAVEEIEKIEKASK